MMELIRGADSKIPEDQKVGPFSSSEVSSKVKEWMNFIVGTNNEGSGALGVSDDRLIIELYSTRKINLDLIDLPGIVAGQIKGEAADIVEKTRNLTEQYVKQPHTLIVLVASNRAERIRNSQAFEMVQRYNKMTQTVGVLTMIDRCADTRRVDDPYWELKERLEGRSDDLPELGGGYVALKNRDTMDTSGVSLLASNVEEAEWFNEHMPGESRQSRSCLGIDNLLSRLLSMLGTYTEETWAKMEKTRLINDRGRVCGELKNMGQVYTDGLDNLLNSISVTVWPQSEDMLKHDVIKTELTKAIEALRADKSIARLFRTESQPPRSSFAHRQQVDVDVTCASDPIAFYRAKGTFIRAVNDVVQNCLEKLVCLPIENILEDIFKPNELPLLLDRFYRLRRGLEHIFKQWAADVSNAIRSKFDLWLSLDEIYEPRVSLRSSPSRYMQLFLTIDGKNAPSFHSRLEDLIMTELAVNPLHTMFGDIVKLGKDLHVWWENESTTFEAHESDDEQHNDAFASSHNKQSPLCKEKSSFSKQRLRLCGEFAALNVMIDTLDGAFPLATTTQSFEKHTSPPRALGKQNHSGGGFSIGSSSPQAKKAGRRIVSAIRPK
mmetsp:Transcript_2146/g.4040  ORF Transcript_2146/g.4040 Transcript_2146/m.4040 type:complete len:606 (-) Transcript_2146:251-2068(-)